MYFIVEPQNGQGIDNICYTYKCAQYKKSQYVCCNFKPIESLHGLPPKVIKNIPISIADISKLGKIYFIANFLRSTIIASHILAGCI